ncbi:hypothetical protein HanRHA438_Chr07g0310551 [Helianthus annuus]|nr:hypothetical protein HanHA89_Chr07g0264161 [Helianthus annuus]KAJ0731619.1 hypothetical protein HanOQP8_Chr07g0254061 [Helianthus annuus]KAJ0908447.1 hypothetical protein HanRHA438_Chr07g0310551 [Helianthus annuus]
MAMRSIIISRAHPLLSNARSARRFLSDQGGGRVLEDEERARENLYVKKMEKEKLEKQKQKLEEKEKTDKDKSDKVL